MSKDDDFIRKALAGFRAEPAEPAVKREALRKALAAFGKGRSGPDGAGLPQGWLLITTLTVAVAVLAIAVNGRLVHETHPAPAVPGSQMLLTEMEKLFPRQLDAVIKDGDAVDLALSELPQDRAADQRILVTLDNGGRKIEVFTYSGQEVCMERSGAHFCFTPLMTGDGEVLVVTDRGVMQAPDEAVLSGYRWSAKALPEVSS